MLNNSQPHFSGTSIYELLEKLGRHLAGADSLSDQEMFNVKKELVMHAQRYMPGQVITLEENEHKLEGNLNHIWILVGKSPDGEIIVWHRPLPCPPSIAGYLK